MKFTVHGVFLATTFALLSPSAALAAEGKHCDRPNPRLAVVVTNWNYGQSSSWEEEPIQQVANGGDEIAALLESAGFCIKRRNDLKKSQLEGLFGHRVGRTIGESELASLLNAGYGSEITMVYYSGHGQMDERSGTGGVYLAPVDGDAKKVETAYSASNLIDTLKVSEIDSGRTSIVMLDTCREGVRKYEYAVSDISEMLGSSSRTLGNNNNQSDKGIFGKTVILYSTYDRQLSYYNTMERFTRWTGAILSRLSRPGRSLLDAVKDAEAEVFSITRGDQLPMIYGSLSLLERVVLFPDTKEQKAWERAQEENTSSAYREFVRSYGYSRYVEEAARRWSALADAPQPSAKSDPEIPKRLVHRALQVVMGLPAGKAELSDAAADKAVRDFQKIRGWPQTGTLTLEQSSSLLEAAATIGDVPSQNTLGIMRTKGIGGPANIPEAERLLRKAAESRQAMPLFNLGVFLLEMKGSAESIKEGCQLMSQAEKAGFEQRYAREIRERFSATCLR